MNRLAILAAALALPACTTTPTTFCTGSDLRRTAYTATIAAADAWTASGRLVPSEVMLARMGAVAALRLLDARCPKKVNDHNIEGTSSVLPVVLRMSSRPLGELKSHSALFTSSSTTSPALRGLALTSEVGQRHCSTRLPVGLSSSSLPDAQHRPLCNSAPANQP